MLFLNNPRYRLLRRIVNKFKAFAAAFVYARYRLMRLVRFRYLRLLVFFMWRLWLRKVHDIERIPLDEPAIVVSNHSSYFDFFVLASVLRKHTVFVAVKNLNARTFVGWFMRLDIIVYVDRERPGYAFFKELLYHLKTQKRTVVIYPEGTRSRSGKMLAPKLGFVKLAMRANVPIIPIAMKGTYEILPPHKKIPSFNKCDIYVGDKIYINPDNPEFQDVFETQPAQKDGSYRLSDPQTQEIAFRIMEKVRRMAGVEWEDDVCWQKSVSSKDEAIIAPTKTPTDKC